MRSSGPGATWRSTRKGCAPSAKDVITIGPTRAIRILPDDDWARDRLTSYFRVSGGGGPEIRVDVNRSPSLGMMPRSMVTASALSVSVQATRATASP